VKLDQVDPKLRWAVVAAEDSRFFVHEGIDWDATAGAIKTTIETRRFGRGGSTITQQLAKNLFLTREKTVLRKVREWVLAWRLDRALPKRRILELYLNVAEWGPSVYGAEQAARHLLGHSAAQLSWGEAATLAAILPSPTNKLRPDRAPGRVRRRRDVVLMHLYDAGRISRAELAAARAAPLTAAEARAAAAAEAREEAALAEATRQPPARASADQAPTASDVTLAPLVPPPGAPVELVPAAPPPAGPAPGGPAPPPAGGPDRAWFEPAGPPAGPSP
jgi:monofunctional biosynthetic peptidoglycan transglycosylase